MKASLTDHNFLSITFVVYRLYCLQNLTKYFPCIFLIQMAFLADKVKQIDTISSFLHDDDIWINLFKVIDDFWNASQVSQSLQQEDFKRKILTIDLIS